MEVLEECVSDVAMNEAEQFHIAYWRFIGARLTNGTEGGDGMIAGTKRAQEVCGKISRSHKERLKNEEARAVLVTRAKAMGVSRRGAKHTTNTIEKMSIAHSHPREAWSAENRIKISRGKGGRPVIDENGIRYETQKEAARQLGIGQSDVHKVVHGKRKTAKGHTLRFI